MEVDDVEVVAPSQITQGHTELELSGNGALWVGSRPRWLAVPEELLHGVNK